MLDLLREFIMVVESLNQSEVRYALVGGLAAMTLSGSIRTTKDLDFLVLPEDCETICESLKKIGYIPKPDSIDFRNGLCLQRLYKINGDGELTIIDLLLANSERYQRIIDNSIQVKIAKQIVPISTKEDLIFMKRARNSPTDQQDIEKLENNNDFS